jgi:hypothetical protein
MANLVCYGKVSIALWSKLIDWVGDDVKCALLASTYAPDQFVDEFWDEISAHELAGTGYTAGGELLTGKSLDDSMLGEQGLRLMADPVQWDATDVEGIRYAVLYVDTGVDATSPLIGYVDYVTDRIALIDIPLVVIPPAEGFVVTSAY